MGRVSSGPQSVDIASYLDLPVPRGSGIYLLQVINSRTGELLEQQKIRVLNP